jgi:hypothetical protein
MREMRLRLRDGAYVGRDTYLLSRSCEGGDIANAISWVNTFRLRVTGWNRRPDGTRVATHFRGRLRSIGTPTQELPEGCGGQGFLLSRAIGRRL